MRIQHLGWLAMTMGILSACSAAPDGESSLEDGWGELESGHPMANQTLALDTDVDEASLEIVDPVDDDDTTPLDDSFETDDGSPDILVDAEVNRAPINHTSLPSPMEVMQACGTTGPYPKWSKGEQLITTEWLNLRTGPGVNHSRITTFAPGTAVAVLAPTCGRAWANVGDAHGHVGWSAVQWLRPKQKSSPASGWQALYSAARGQFLASTSWKMWHGKPDVGMCLRGTRKAIDASISPGFSTGSPGAHQFGVFARSHRTFMKNHHMTVYALGENDVPKPSQFPAGTIMVFSRGRCGADPTWGHIEIVINSKTACSDYCRKRTDNWCGPDTIILPRK